MHVTDDRGRLVKLIPQRQLSIGPGLPSPIPMEARQRMHGEAQDVYRTREMLVPLVIGLLCIFIWAGIWVNFAPRLFSHFPAHPTVQGIITGLLPSLPLPFVMYFIIRASRHRVARIVAHHGYCATCGYQLAGLTPAPDRCTVCPECGSAWRIPTAKDA